jgi:hypothetical protein
LSRGGGPEAVVIVDGYDCPVKNLIQLERSLRDRRLIEAARRLIGDFH